MHSNKFNLVAVLKGWGLGLLLCTSFAASAATSVGHFSVAITLTGTDTGSGAGAGVNTAAQSAPGVCISETLSEQTNAIVRVVCGTNQFVSITANPNARFLGTNGGAFRFVLDSGNADAGLKPGGQGRSNDFQPGTGTITALRIYNVNGSDGPLEILLTF